MSVPLFVASTAWGSRVARLYSIRSTSRAIISAVVSRRWITLACVGAADTVVPIRSHVYAALKSGDISLEQMEEFVLQFALHSGWPKASFMQQVVAESWQRCQEEAKDPQPLPVLPPTLHA